jgi:DNA polymerase, archaea type
MDSIVNYTSAKASDKKNKSQQRLIPLIRSNQPEVKDSASIDLEWIPFKGKYQHDKTKIFAACFCTNYGEKILLHISDYPTEKELVEDILFYFNQFPLTFGWYTTGVAVYDDDNDNNNDDYNNTGLRIRGRDSDFFVLHQRCNLYGLKSPFEIKRTYVRLVDWEKRKHIDLHEVFSKSTIQDGVFEGKYRITGLDSVSQALLGIGKYAKLSTGAFDILLLSSLPVEEQKRYVKRDAELAMLLAQHNNCLALRIMKVFAGYAEMDYYQVCHTNVNHWYANRYKRMLESGKCTVTYTPNYRLPKQDIAGGHHTTPVKGFFINTKIYELDIKGQYPSIVITNNYSFDTLNCTCCKYNPDAQVRKETIDIINEQLEKNKIDRRVDKYWVCQRLKGAFPKVLEQVLGDRDRYLNLLKKVKASSPDSKLIEEYQTHQLGAKLFANAGFGVFANEFFEFSNYLVAECITADGRRIHRQMEQMGCSDPFNFQIVFGFTDSTFFANATEQKVEQFIHDCKDKIGVTVELKNIFTNSIFYGKKNRFVAWTGKNSEKDELIIKGLDGLSDSNPLWVRNWFREIVTEIVKHPETRFESIPKMIEEAVSDLDNGHFNTEEELRFTQRLAKSAYEYDQHVRASKLAKILGKDKGELVWWYETYTEEYVKSKKCYKRKKSYSIKPENLNLYEYKNFLLKKLKDTLEIAGFNFLELKEKLIIINEDEQGHQTNQVDQSNQNSKPTTTLEGGFNEIIIK